MSQPTPLTQSSPEQDQVGISCFITSGNPIPAVTKYLLTDFIVNEIDQQGRVVSLKAKPNPTAVSHQQQQQNKTSYTMDNQVYKQVVSHFGKDAANALSELYGKLQSGERIGQWQYLIEKMPEMTKQQRKTLHEFVREKLVDIESNTLPANAMKLKFSKNTRKINPALRNKYTHFILFKSNIDTMGAIFKLSKITGINQKLFSTAGLKDKRGVTTQMTSVFNTPIDMLRKFYASANRNKELWIDGFSENMESDIGVGDLWGNQFALILRLINPSDSQYISQRINSLKHIGMINYFGLQRFGTCGTKTHMIGLKLVKKRWKEVVEELLLQNAGDETINKLKADCYNNQQYAKAERQLSNKYKIEKCIFRGLKKFGKNYQNVFDSLPRSIKTLYAHSLQSYLWNKMVTRRIRQFGTTVVNGDLLAKHKTGYAKFTQQAKQSLLSHPQQQNNEEDDYNNLEQSQEEEKCDVQLVTQSTQALGNIIDVVLPLFGAMTALPEHSLARSYLTDELEALGLTEEELSSNYSKKLCFKGMYRKIVVKPNCVTFRIISHGNAKDELQSPFYTIGEEVETAGGARRAVQIMLQLPKSSYATMALREVLHISSSFETQILLNKLYQEQKDGAVDDADKSDKSDKLPQNKMEHN